MSSNLYAPDKVLAHPDRLITMRSGGRVVPINVQLIISDLCNQDCHYCAYRASNGISSQQFAGLDKHGKLTHNPNRMISAQKVIEILDDAKSLGVKSITWTGGGEPTVHPDHMELFGHALKLGLECSLNTNGAVLRPGWEYVLPRFTYLRFSFDGSTPEEYKAIRRSDQFHRVLDNMACVAGFVKEHELPCVVGVGYVVTPQFAESTVEAVRALKKTGVSYVRLASMQSTDGASAYGDRFELAKASVRDALALSDNNFKVVSLFESALGQKMEDPFCGFQEAVCYIGGNQHVYRCCYTAYAPIGDIGDLSRQSFREWFEGDSRAQTIKQFDARTCFTCPLAAKNAAITDAIRAPVLPPVPTGLAHVNFP